MTHSIETHYTDAQGRPEGGHPGPAEEPEESPTVSVMVGIDTEALQVALVVEATGPGGEPIRLKVLHDPSEAAELAMHLAKAAQELLGDNRGKGNLIVLPGNLKR